MKKFKDVRSCIKAKLQNGTIHDLNALAREYIAADIWKTFCVVMDTPVGTASIDVTQDMLKSWKVTVEDLNKAANENCGEPIVQSLIEMIGLPFLPMGIDMYVVTNQEKTFGASAVLLPKVQEELSSIFPQGYYILPSSVHECIVVPAISNVEELVALVYMVNRSEVDVNERLSDHVFTVENNVLDVVM